MPSRVQFCPKTESSLPIIVLFRVLYFFIIVSLFSYCQASHSKIPVNCSSLYPELPLTKANLSLFAPYAKHLVTCTGPMWGTMWNQNTFQMCSLMNVNNVDKHLLLRTVFKYTDIEFISLTLKIIHSRAFHAFQFRPYGFILML